MVEILRGRVAATVWGRAATVLGRDNVRDPAWVDLARVEGRLSWYSGSHTWGTSEIERAEEGVGYLNSYLHKQMVLI